MIRWMQLESLRDEEIEEIEQCWCDEHEFPPLLARAVKTIIDLKQYVRENRIDRTAARILRYEYTAMNEGLRLSKMDWATVVQALRTAAGSFRREAELPMPMAMEQRQGYEAKAEEFDALADQIEGKEKNERARV